jgi:DNA polymerase III subunit delta'
MLIGHETPQSDFIAAAVSGRLHHAWLLAGPPGVGKGTFAKAAAAWLLARAMGPADGIDADRLHVDADHRTARLIAAGSHMDLRTLAREPNDRGALRSEIVVDQVRALQPLFQSTPGLSDRRIVIVDAIDEMNRAAANAFLKNLEEPPAATIFLLVSHAPGRLLPTIRSRCRTLRFQPLTPPQVDLVMQAQYPESSAAEREALVRIAEGAPGRALRFAGLDIGGIEAALDALDGSANAALSLARSLAGKSAQPRYEAFLELVPQRIATAARMQRGAALAESLDRYERAAKLAQEALPLQLPAEQVALQLALLSRASG